MSYKKSIIGGGVAFIVATSCCWLPAFVIAIGGGSTLFSISKGLENYSGIFMLLGSGLLGLGIYQFMKKRSLKENDEVILASIITCPECGHQKEEVMPTNACQFFYECEQCKKVLKPLENDCCVYCSYGTVECPPMQLDQKCC